MANDPRRSQAAAKVMEKEGFGSGASRLVCGNMKAHRLLEKRLAQFKGCEDGLIFSTGYMANIGIITSLFGREDMIFSDRLNHASIVDGIRLSQAQFKRYAHCDMSSLEELLKNSTCSAKRVIITDSIFSMDGDIAPLDRIVQLARRYGCLVMVDEAHGFGVMGEKGRGLAEHFGLERQIDIHMGTLSKAAGSFGAYVVGRKTMIDYLVNRARSFIYTTGMPPSIAAASLKAVDIIQSEPELRSRLWMNTNTIKEGLSELGFDTMNSQKRIIPILLKDNQLALEYSQELYHKGIFVSAIRPPTVPSQTARLRVSVTAKHTPEQCQQLLTAMHDAGEKLCLI